VVDLKIPSSTSTPNGFQYFDVSGDNVLSPIDVLQVINFLVRQSRAAEGEASEIIDQSVPPVTRADTSPDFPESHLNPSLATHERDQVFAELPFDDRFFDFQLSESIINSEQQLESIKPSRRTTTNTSASLKEDLALVPSSNLQG